MTEDKEPLKTAIITQCLPTIEATQEQDLEFGDNQIDSHVHTSTSS